MAGQRGWDGYRAFVVARREAESDTVMSFYLVPEDGGEVPDHRPGQSLGFALEIPGDVPGRMTPVVRNYTISDCARDGAREGTPEGGHYRLSIKREPAPADQPDLPPGVSSNFFHDHVNVGSVLQVRAPSGEFALRAEGKGPVVLLSGGVGCTPMIAMLNAIAHIGASRDVWFVHGVRNGREHAFAEHVRQIAQTHDNIRAHICYSRPDADDVLGVDYDSRGHVSIDVLRGLLPDTSPQFFLCGSPPFMKSLYNGLIEWGVDELQIAYEFFGNACELRQTSKPTPEAATTPEAAPTAAAPTANTPDGAADTPFQVEFRQSGVVAPWTPGDGTILDLAEAHGVDPDFVCRAGACHSCLSTVLEGAYEYIHDDVVIPMGEDEVLICSARPKSDMVVDV